MKCWYFPRFRPFTNNWVLPKCLKKWMIKCIHGCVGGYTLEYCISFLDGKNSLNKQCRTWWNAKLCGISSGYSLFAKLCICEPRVCKDVWVFLRFSVTLMNEHTKQNHICCFQVLKVRIRYSRLFNLKIWSINWGVLISLIFIDV